MGLPILLGRPHRQDDDATQENKDWDEERLQEEHEADDEVTCPRRAVLAERLQVGSLALRRIRAGVAATMLAVGVGLSIGYMWIIQEGTQRAKHMTNVQSCQRIDQSDIFLDAFLADFCFYGRYLCFALVPLADDLLFTRCVLGLDILVSLSGYRPLVFFYTHRNKYPDTRELDAVINAFLAAVPVMALVIGFILAIRCSEPVAMQRRLWGSLQVWIVSSAVGVIYGSFKVAWLHCGRIAPDILNFPFMAVLMYFACRPDLRHRVHERLNRIIVTHGALRAAAGLASLTCGCSVNQALSIGTERFRSVRLSDLAAEDVADRSPDPTLFWKTSPGRSQGCDAFVSHSWSDDSDAKWLALQKWRANFVATHGREPTIWFDKTCIDQADIKGNTQYLPVFLSSCDSLLVLCGPTYMSRLWCVLELFTYFHVGGDKIGPIEFVPIVREGYESEDYAAITSSIASFDAASCRCYDDLETERLLSIIRVGFGSLSAFTDVLRASFAKVGFTFEISSFAGTVSGDKNNTSDNDGKDGDGYSCTGP